MLFIFVTGITFAFFLGLYLGYRKKHSYDGKMFVEHTGDGKKLFTLELNLDPEVFDKRTYISFQVVPEPPPFENITQE